MEQRRRIEEKRIQTQNKRTLEQQEKAFQRVHQARKRGEAITGIDTMEKKKDSQGTNVERQMERKNGKIQRTGKKIQLTIPRIKINDSS